VTKANAPYKYAVLEIIRQFWDRRHVLAPKQQLAIRNKGSLFLACPEPEDLAAFKKACIADESTYEYLGLGSRRVKKGIDFTANRKSRTNVIEKARKTKRGELINARRFATKTDEFVAVEAPMEAMEVDEILPDVEEAFFGNADNKIDAVEDLAQTIKATEEVGTQFDDDEAAFWSDEGYEIAAALFDDADSWIRAEEDHVQPIKATDEVEQANETQFDDDEAAFLSDEGYEIAAALFDDADS
jgi:hypothetical protein